MAKTVEVCYTLGLSWDTALKSNHGHGEPNIICCAASSRYSVQKIGKQQVRSQTNFSRVHDAGPFLNIQVLVQGFSWFSSRLHVLGAGDSMTHALNPSSADIASWFRLILPTHTALRSRNALR